MQFFSSLRGGLGCACYSFHADFSTTGRPQQAPAQFAEDNAKPFNEKFGWPERLRRPILNGREWACAAADGRGLRVLRALWRTRCRHRKAELRSRLLATRGLKTGSGAGMSALGGFSVDTWRGLGQRTITNAPITTKVRMVKPRCLTRLGTRTEESNRIASGRVRWKPDDDGTRNESEAGQKKRA